MKPRQPSVTSWCGFLVLALLLGVWVDSYRSMSLVTCSQPGGNRFWSVSLENGRIVWRTLEEEMGSAPSSDRAFWFFREPAGISYGDGYGFIWRKVQDIDRAVDASGKERVVLRQYTTRLPYAPVPGSVFPSLARPACMAAPPPAQACGADGGDGI